MMVSVAEEAATAGTIVVGATASVGPPMITREADLRGAVGEVLGLVRQSRGADGIIISAFGDPGLDEARVTSSIPVVGICEASILEASEGGRRFGIATVTPDLRSPIEDRVRLSGRMTLYTGMRLTAGDPMELASSADALREALAGAVSRCFEEDGADAVIIGGGPLAAAAAALSERFRRPVVAPIPAAVRQLERVLVDRRRHG